MTRTTETKLDGKMDIFLEISSETVRKQNF